VTTATRLGIATTTLPVARTGKRYQATVHTTGGAGPVRLRLAGPRPRWLVLEARTGKLSGTPKLKPRKPLVVVKRTKHGVKRVVKRRPPLPHATTVHVTATDALGQRSTRTLRLTIRPRS